METTLGIERRGRGAGIAVAMVLLSATVWGLSRLPNLAATSIAAVLLLVPVLFAISRSRTGQLDFFEVFLPFSLLYFLYFGASALYMIDNPEELLGLSVGPYLLPAMGVALVGYVAVTLGYLTTFRGARPSPLGRFTLRGGTPLAIFGIVGFIGQMATLFQFRLVASGLQVSTLLSTLQQFAPLFFVAWSLAWYLLWAKRLHGGQRFVFLALLVPQAAVILFYSVGGKELTLLILGLPVLAYWYTRRVLPWKAIAAMLLVAIFVIFPLYNNFRYQNRNLDTSTRIGRSLLAASEWNSHEFVDNSYVAFMRRMAIINSIAAIVRDVPEAVDYKRGETLFLTPISILIPRFVWPDKPSINIGHEFARTFQLVRAWDVETQIAPSIVGEFYWNFHIPGVVVGMFLVGAVLRWVYARYGAGTSFDPLRKSVYLAVLAKVMHFEGNVAMLVGAVVKLMIVLAVAFFVFRRMGLLVPSEAEPEDRPA